MSDDANKVSFTLVPENITTVTDNFRLTETPWYPMSIMVGDCTIRLLPNGKWEGSIEGLRQAMADAKGFSSDGTAKVLLWLVLREMEHDSRFW